MQLSTTVDYITNIPTENVLFWCRGRIQKGMALAVIIDDGAKMVRVQQHGRIKEIYRDQLVNKHQFNDQFAELALEVRDAR